MGILNDFRKAQTDQAEIEQQLRDSFFAEGHIGFDYGSDAPSQFVAENTWTLEEVSIASLMDENQIDRIIEWIDEEDEQYEMGYDEGPIIIAPDSYSEQPLTNMPGYSVYDGWHRLGDAARAGRETIQAYVGRPV